jgi:FHA domain
MAVRTDLAPARQVDLARSTVRRGRAWIRMDSRADDSGNSVGEEVGVYFDWWDGRERRVLVLDGDRLSVGSAPNNDVVVDDPSVSRVHAMVQELNGRWFIEDCGSRNGTALNGRRLTGMVSLQPDDEVQLGRARLRFRGQPSPGGRPTDTVVARPAITPRERDVLIALCAPLANGDVFTEPATIHEMAAALHVTENAVKLHLTSLAEKFGIRGAERRRSRLANAALDAGVVTLADLRGSE